MLRSTAFLTLATMFSGGGRQREDEDCKDAGAKESAHAHNRTIDVPCSFNRLSDNPGGVNGAKVRRSFDASVQGSPAKISDDVGKESDCGRKSRSSADYGLRSCVFHVRICPDFSILHRRGH